MDINRVAVTYVLLLANRAVALLLTPSWLFLRNEEGKMVSRASRSGRKAHCTYFRRDKSRDRELEGGFDGAEALEESKANDLAAAGERERERSPRLLRLRWKVCGACEISRETRPCHKRGTRVCCVQRCTHAYSSARFRSVRCRPPPLLSLRGYG